MKVALALIDDGNEWIDRFYTFLKLQNAEFYTPLNFEQAMSTMVVSTDILPFFRLNRYVGT